MQTREFFTRPNNNERYGLILGFLAIVGFSVTLPATRLAVSYIDPTLVGPGRALLAAIVSLTLLYGFKIPLPTARQWLSISIVMFGVVIAFPWLTSIAMQDISGAQGGIIVSMIPLFTAIAGALLLRQRPSMGFWFMAILGSALLLIYLLLSHSSGDTQGVHIQKSELILLTASILCAAGYAQGGKLAHQMGGIAVISWALVLSIPFSIFAIIYTWTDKSAAELLHSPWQAWASLAYISLVSQLLAFIFWYRGLALGGVIRVSQVQLLQPFMTLLVSAVLLNETITLLMMIFATAVVITVAISRKMPIHPAPRFKKKNSL
ncbi:Permease of the drug/metabolite transporter (DMT) superfamily [hydrothermal vent metagenome]|uniref:Permease of the drug/metabolite transporter (DMT) superfamily n=1 Tax=hydrothermal vent metagenome TaxID=652676 RepID=A0A3B0XGZ4_9ZZZZ